MEKSYIDSNRYHWFRYRNGHFKRAGLARRNGRSLPAPKAPPGATYFGAYTKRTIQFRHLFVL